MQQNTKRKDKNELKTKKGGKKFNKQAEIISEQEEGYDGKMDNMGSQEYGGDDDIVITREERMERVKRLQDIARSATTRWKENIKIKSEEYNHVQEKYI